MAATEAIDDGRKLYESPRFPKDDKGPVFEQPWQAQAFAMVLKLYQGGAFTWDEWVRALSEEIAAGTPAGVDPSDGANSIYYHQWLAALEKLSVAKGLASSAAMAKRKEEWRRAYVKTPHGEPIELARGQTED